MGYCVLLYLMNSGIRNFFGIIIFGIKYISVVRIGLYKFIFLMVLSLVFNVFILVWLMLSDDLVLWDLLADVFTTVGDGAGVVDCINVGFCWGFWLCSFIFFSGWTVVGAGLKVIGWLEGFLSEVFFSVCLSKLVRWVIFIFRDFNSSCK